jgi:hypothetical protein
MVKLFNRGLRAARAVSSTVDEIICPDYPVNYLPSAAREPLGSIGDDINLPLLVRELGGRKKLTLSKRRQQLLKELNTIDKELMQLDVLLDAAEKL